MAEIATFSSKERWIERFISFSGRKSKRACFIMKSKLHHLAWPVQVSHFDLDTAHVLLDSAFAIHLLQVPTKQQKSVSEPKSAFVLASCRAPAFSSSFLIL